MHPVFEGYLSVCRERRQARLRLENVRKDGAPSTGQVPCRGKMGWYAVTVCPGRHISVVVFPLAYMQASDVFCYIVKEIRKQLSRFINCCNRTIKNMLSEVRFFKHVTVSSMIDTVSLQKL